MNYGHVWGMGLSREMRRGNHSVCKSMKVWLLVLGFEGQNSIFISQFCPRLIQYEEKDPCRLNSPETEISQVHFIELGVRITTVHLTSLALLPFPPVNNLHRRTKDLRVLPSTVGDITSECHSVGCCGSERSSPEHAASLLPRSPFFLLSQATGRGLKSHNLEADVWVKHLPLSKDQQGVFQTFFPSGQCHTKCFKNCSYLVSSTSTRLKGTGDGGDASCTAPSGSPTGMSHLDDMIDSVYVPFWATFSLAAPGRQASFWCLVAMLAWVSVTGHHSPWGCVPSAHTLLLHTQMHTCLITCPCGGCVPTSRVSMLNESFWLFGL